ncbi:MAG: bromoperoxidase [Pseudomonadota bacterium]
MALDRREEAARAAHPASKNHKKTQVNADEATLAEEGFGGSFTKGLEHDPDGFVKNAYGAFQNAVNRPGAFPADRWQGDGFKTGPVNGVAWRGWESPRAGHYYDLQGPDADAVGMAPAPGLTDVFTDKNGGDLPAAELTAEMAEVYAMALLRDHSFAEIATEAGNTPAVLAALNAVPVFQYGYGGAASLQSLRRLAGRFQDPADFDNLDNQPVGGQFTGRTVFFGSGPGAKTGGYISQFLLTGNSFMRTGGAIDDAFIGYGSQVVSQKSRVFPDSRDFMTVWSEWHDVQSGADRRGDTDANFVKPGGAYDLRFMHTPRHMATYVRFDALYQAYLNACLLLLGSGSPFQPGFPDANGGVRTPFASWGGPHVLSLVTEVATRCLKLARRQKFNFHRRARPERIGGLLTAEAGGRLSGKPVSARIAASMIAQLGALAGLVDTHARKNGAQFGGTDPGWMSGARNLLLPMAFAEGSPMHPAYAAGHATLAGGCVTMLKAFFQTLYEGGKPLPFSRSMLQPVKSIDDGRRLAKLNPDEAAGLTIEGELNKLAANISIARNMAGVHYYSDYYDSLRMGERVAVGMLYEQMFQYDEGVEMTFRSYDGDLVKLACVAPGKPSIQITRGPSQVPVAWTDWWYRHMP